MKQCELGLAYFDCNVGEELQTEYKPNVSEFCDDKHFQLCVLFLLSVLSLRLQKTFSKHGFCLNL